MITFMIIQEIKELSSNISKKQLSDKYYQALELLTPEDLVMIRNSYAEEASVAVLPDLEHLY